MTDNKLFEVIKYLSSVEKRAFTSFVKSPYHNRREDVIALWEAWQTGKSSSLTAELLYARVYADEAFDDANWRHLQSMLLGCIEACLAQRYWKQHPLWLDLPLATVYREKQLRKPLEHKLRRAEEQLGQLPRDSHFYHLQYQLEWERYVSAQVQQGRSQENNLAAVIRSFDIYAVAGKLRLACLMESHRAVFPVAFEDAFLTVLLQLLEKSELVEVPIVALYYHCYQSLTGGGEDSFRAFRDALEKQGRELPEEENRTFTLLAINFCIRRLNMGEVQYVREAFDLYRIGLETRALLEHGFLSRFAFKNIVALGLRLKEFDWVIRFIQDFEPFLEEKYRNAHRDFNMAKVYFTLKNYKLAMPLLARVDENDLLLNLDSRVMLLKMYYETDATDALDALLASFKILLLRKKKLIGYHSTHYLNTLRYIQKLTRLNQNDRQATQVFREEIEANKLVIEKEWLLEQLPWK